MSFAKTIKSYIFANTDETIKDKLTHIDLHAVSIHDVTGFRIELDTFESQGKTVNCQTIYIMDNAGGQVEIKLFSK